MRTEQAIQLVGDAELQQTLLGLTDRVLKNVLRPAIAAGLKIVQKQAKENARPGAELSVDASGLLSKAIISSAKAKDKTNITGKVTVNSKIEGMVDGEMQNPAKISILVEMGHGGPHPADPHPFMRPAMDAKKGEALSRITEVARQRLPIEVEKARAKDRPVFLSEGGA